jgi:hypothetical protein
VFCFVSPATGKGSRRLLLDLRRTRQPVLTLDWRRGARWIFFRFDGHRRFMDEGAG